MPQQRHAAEYSCCCYDTLQHAITPAGEMHAEYDAVPVGTPPLCRFFQHIAVCAGLPRHLITIAVCPSTYSCAAVCPSTYSCAAVCPSTYSCSAVHAATPCYLNSSVQQRRARGLTYLFCYAAVPAQCEDP